MEEYRCKSYSDGRMEIERCSSSTYSGNKNTWENEPSNNNDNNNGVVFQEIRSYSTSSYATSVKQPKELRDDKRANGSFSKTAWCFGDPEMQRKKRVASYKSYNVEGKLKRSFTKSFRWIKHRYSNMVHGA